MPIWLAILLSVVVQQSLAYENVSKVQADKRDHKILVFLSQKCPCSQSHVNHLNGLAKKHKDIAFFGVITEPINKDNQEAINEYFTSQRFQFPLIEDSTQTLVKKYGALKTPHVTLLKGEKVLYQGGVSNHRFFNQASKKFLETNISDLKNKKPLSYSRGPSMGCYIRRI